MKKMFKAFDYACDKYYRVVVDIVGSTPKVISGILLNYTDKEIMLLAEKGIYHIQHKNILLLIPIEPPTAADVNEKYREVLKSFGFYKEEKDGCER